uniref:Mobilization protein mbeA n=1 Tax=Erwinia amylovora ATCC BAA-2158 TaxID=889211 RepID=E5BAZ1_ERWAM|nr:Mobilization protein mbeA [Erwinia amylovora ATCC BAA-2158]
MAYHRPGLRPADRLERGHSVVAGESDARQLHEHPGAEGRAGEAERENVRSELPERQQRAVSGIAERREGRNELDGGEREAERRETGTGVEQHDGAGKTVAERIRAATAGLLEKAGRVGERLRGMVEDVWSYATGERGAERARHGLEQAGAEFERAAAPVVVRLNGIEAHREQERAAQHQKALELERSQRQRTYDGPSL